MSSIKVRVLPDRTVEIEGGDPEEVRRVLLGLVGSGAVLASSLPLEPKKDRRQRRPGERTGLVLEALRSLGGGTTAAVYRALANAGHITSCHNVTECLLRLEKKGAIKREAATGTHPGPWYGKTIALWMLVEPADGGGA